MNDLTPQLRTRLSRVERLVGLFVLFALGLLLAGFLYYVYQTGERKGWFVTKVRFCTSLGSAAGLAVGTPVNLWGFEVGEVTRIDTMPEDSGYAVYVEFTVRAPYFGYLCTAGTVAKVTAADFLGKRSVEVTKGRNYTPVYLVWPVRTLTPQEAMGLPDLTNWVSLDRVPPSGTNEIIRLLAPPSPAELEQAAAAGVTAIRLADRARELPQVTQIWDQRTERYAAVTPETKPYWLMPEESPALTERLDLLINETERSLAQYLPTVLSNVARLTANADQLLAQAQPLLTNATVISAHLTNREGALGDWLLPTNLNHQLLTTLTNADGTLISATLTLTNAGTLMAEANSNLTRLVTQLQPPLENLSGIISNLNTQVQANTNFVATLSDLLRHTDELIQGFKRHWFLRGAFKEKPTNRPPETFKPTRSPKDAQNLR